MYVCNFIFVRDPLQHFLTRLICSSQVRSLLLNFCQHNWIPVCNPTYILAPLTNSSNDRIFQISSKRKWHVSFFLNSFFLCQVQKSPLLSLLLTTSVPVTLAHLLVVLTLTFVLSHTFLFSLSLSSFTVQIWSSCFSLKNTITCLSNYVPSHFRLYTH